MASFFLITTLNLKCLCTFVCTAGRAGTRFQLHLTALHYMLDQDQRAITAQIYDRRRVDVQPSQQEEAGTSQRRHTHTFGCFTSATSVDRKVTGSSRSMLPKGTEDGELS